jgi:hypothetical protein
MREDNRTPSSATMWYFYLNVIHSINLFDSLIQYAAQHVNETAKAIESGNSTTTLGLLAEIRADLNNINGNITDLIFSVSKTPP